MNSKSDELRRLIGSLRHRTSSGRFFVVFEDLQQTTSEALISGAFEDFRHPMHQHAKFVSTIIKHGLKVFSILVWIHQENKIIPFIERDELDSRLPMSKESVRAIDNTVEDRFWNEVQWEYLPYVFLKDDFHRILRDEAILPFITEEKYAEGSSGELFKSTIHISQQSFPSKKGTPNICVIRKRIKSLETKNTTKSLFENEIECLELLRNLRHKNIIELLGSYTYRGEHNFIFPILPMDLSDFLKFDKRYGQFKDNLIFYNALHGLASAIEVVHNLRLQAQQHQGALTKIGYHHDIRPKNILVTQSTFILADFGLARFKDAEENSRTPWKSGVGDHIAPECMDEEFNSLDVGRSMDIWSFGCIVASVATYMEQSVSGLENFKTQRFYDDKKNHTKQYYFFQGNQVKPKVLSWFDGLDRKAKDDGLRCLTKLVRAMLQIREKDRPSARTTCQRLCYISCKTIFRALIDLISNVSSQLLGAKALSILDFQYNLAMLRAWGRVFAMDTDRISHELFEDGIKTGEIMKTILDQLFVDFQAFSNDTIKGHQTINQSTRVLPALHPINEGFRQSVRNLFETAPQVYQKRLAQECRLDFLKGKDEKRLKDIEQNKHLFAPDSEISEYSALKRLEAALWNHVKNVRPSQEKFIIRSGQISATTTFDEIHQLARFDSYKPSSFPKDAAESPLDHVLIEWM